jgi:hypothetical protein
LGLRAKDLEQFTNGYGLTVSTRDIKKQDDIVARFVGLGRVLMMSIIKTLFVHSRRQSMQIDNKI